MTLNVITQGQGSDLVLLHGWAFSSQVWQPLIAELSRHWRIHLVDLPGHGHSRPHSEPLSIPGYCAALAHQLPQSAHYLGWSLGGMIATAMAIHYPARVNKLILIGSTPQFVCSDHWNEGMNSEVFENFKKKFHIDFKLALTQFMALQTRGDSKQKNIKKILAEIKNKAPLANLKGLNEGLILLEKCNFRKQLKAISSPSLIIHGRNDPLVPVQAGHYLHGQIMNAQLCIFDEAGHLPFLHNSPLFLSTLTDFLT